MSSDFYFRKWKATLSRLQVIAQLDLEYQNSRAHDKRRCKAVMRLSGVLGQYNVVYNEALDCLQQNLQVQKTEYMMEVVKAITDRIIEIKHQITKLECSNIQFLGHGLAHHKLTTNDAELLDIPLDYKRQERVNILISESLRKAIERKEEFLKIAEKEAKEKGENLRIVKNWWEEDTDLDDDSVVQELQVQKDKSEESVEKMKMLVLIQAHERCRQVTQRITHQKQKRQMWEKELAGTLQPQPCHELKDRSAKLIQKVLRAYFEIKRRKKLQLQKDEILGMRFSVKSEKDAPEEKVKLRWIQKKERIEKEWKKSCETLRGKYVIKSDDLKEYYRDYTRNWFRKWFDEIQYFHDIPKENDGGLILIMKDELLEPTDWWEEYQKQKSSKNKSFSQRKWAKLEAKKEEILRKKEELIKKKLQANLMIKLMKNPKLHPGFEYQKSEKTQHILDVIENYNHDWKNLDDDDVRNVKERFAIEVDLSKIYAEIKMEGLKIVDEDMREELKILKKALQTDYLNNAKKMPQPMRNPKQQTKKKKKEKRKIISENISDLIQDLAFKGIIKQYPKLKLENFMGDHNYAGDDMRCKYEKARQFGGELRSVWWEQCRVATHGFHRVLIVGPRRSGKTLLVHALASLNEATLFELNPDEIHEQTSSAADLHQIMTSVVACARATQPSVIYMRHVHRFYYNKVPPREAIPNLDEMKRILLRKLCKKIQKKDKITVIATCVDPWQTKSSELLKQFPRVILIPDTNYTTVIQLLNKWVDENHAVPRDLDIQSLARMLRGYSYGYLKETLSDFLTPDRIVKISAYGLSPQEVYDFISSNESETKVDYEKYIKWYYDKTHWGKKETKHIKEQLEFQQALDKFVEKMKKINQPSVISSADTIPNSDIRK